MQTDGKFDAVSSEKIDTDHLKHECLFAKRPIMMYVLNKHLIEMYGLKNGEHLMMHCLKSDNATPDEGGASGAT
eukprot:15511757-Heterocapsa_arctica.AAC.1